MYPRDNIRPEGDMNSAVPRHARHFRKSGRCNHHFPMAFARSVIARVTGMAMAVIDHLQRGGRKRRLQCVVNFLFKRHYFYSNPFNLISYRLCSNVRVGKVA